ncbi:T9SS type A sorting domain-containing protein [bacterium]|nr:T9SS type A sorting domain-containing protein [bacterium]
MHFVIPFVSALAPNFPNPFNPETWIPYELAQSCDVKVVIYDIQGRPVRVIDLGHQEIGQYITKEQAAHWNGRNDAGETVSSGIYFYQIQAGDFKAMRKMVILK